MPIELTELSDKELLKLSKLVQQEQDRRHETSNTLRGYTLPKDMKSTEIKPIEKTNVSIACWDMRKICADAYIVPDFTDGTPAWWVWWALWETNATSGMQAYNNHIENNEVKFGDNLIVDSWWGNSKYIIHVVTCNHYGDKDKERAKNLIPTTIYQALLQAQKKWITSVVIPALQTWEYGHLSNSESAQAILKGIQQFAQQGWKMNICLVSYTQDWFWDFAYHLQNQN